jgi:hypothetical protein
MNGKPAVIKERPDLNQGQISPINAGRPAFTFIAGVLLSYSRILRVIGQDLEPLGVNVFELAKVGDDFSVLMNQSGTEQVPPAKGTFDKITLKIFGRPYSPRETPHRKYYTSREILVADTERKSRRSPSYSPSDLRNLSLELRGLGDYLDRKAAGDFTISWAPAPDLIKVRYDQKSESFTMRDLYDFGIHMYMKRSDRIRPD